MNKIEFFCGLAMNIPDDVLAIIARYVISDVSQILNFILVCKRFRSVILLKNATIYNAIKNHCLVTNELRKHLDSRYAHDEDIIRLVEMGADVNVHKSDGYTLLMHSVNRGAKVETLEFLLKKGACVNAKTAVGNTALIYAARFKSNEIIIVLLNAGADRSIQNNHANTAYDFAIHRSSQLGDKPSKSYYAYMSLMLNPCRVKLPVSN